MTYEFPVTVPLWTVERVPQELQVNLTPGVITQVMVAFPAGCSGLVGLRILQGLFQVWPLTSGEWFISDDFVIVLPAQYDLTSGADKLRIEMYNLDEANPHTVTTYFTIEVSVEYLKELVEVVSEGFPNLRDALVAQLEPLKEATGSIAELLSEGIFPSMQEVLELMRRERELKVAKMTVAELTIL